MRFHKLIALVFIFIFSNSYARKRSYTEVPALVHLYLTSQNDTNGFNIVRELPALFYKNILENKLTLWDSPKKQIAISASALQSIEKNNNTYFSNVESLFINELWTSNRRRTQFYIAGFSFLAETDRGRVAFGYIDAKEAYKIMSTNFLTTNVDGAAELNFIDALYSRKYDFSLVQFGSNDFSKKIDLAYKIKKDAFYSNKKIEGLYHIPNTKMVAYTIEKNHSDPNDMGSVLIKGIESYLNNHRDVFFAIGGKNYFDVNNYKNELTVTRLEFTEVWENKGNYNSYNLRNIKIYINNKPLNTLTLQEFNNWNIIFNFKTIEDIVTEKKYLFSIFKLNSVLLPPNEASIYLKALKEYKWTQVSQYVKYNNN